MIFLRRGLLALIAILLAGCSAQPLTLDQEMEGAAIAGAIGAGSGAIFAYSASKSYPVSIGIGVGGMVGAYLIYEEIKREAAMESVPGAQPPDYNPPAPSGQNP